MTSDQLAFLGALVAALLMGMTLGLIVGFALFGRRR
jgi:predicted transporter